MIKMTMMRVRRETLDEMNKLRLRPNESYEDILQRLIREHQLTERLLAGKFEDPGTMNTFAMVISHRLKEMEVEEERKRKKHLQGRK